MSNTDTAASGLNFSGLGLSPKILEVLARLKFTVPTPIQHKAIPIAVTGKDVIGIAQTGTGKTLAFALPLLQEVGRTKKRGLILLPTRELAIQVSELLHTVGHSFGLRQAMLIGGASMGLQKSEIRRNPHIIIGTPGRINDFIDSAGLKLSDVGVLVLDEADRMLDMGFAPQIKRILHQVPKDRQTMLFSATMPPEIVKMAAVHMKLPVRVEVARAGSVADKINQEIFIVQKEQKNRLLDKLLTEYKGTVLVFSRTKYGAKRICHAIKGMNHTAAEIHSNLSLSQRKRSLEGFKKGNYRVLVATDIAARGIDVTNIELVINFDLPDNTDDYIHRIGRTGRAGRAGQAITFITPDQRSKISSLERLVRMPLKVSPLPELPAARHNSSAHGYQTQETQVAPGHRRTTFRHADRGRRPATRRRPERNAHRRSRSRGRTRVHV